MSMPLDVRYGIRRLNNNVGFTIVAVACLALGICASVTVFSVIDPLLLRPFPGVRDQGRIVSLSCKPVTISGIGGEVLTPGLSYPAFQLYRRTAAPRIVTDLVTYLSIPINLQWNDEPRRVTGQVVSDNYFQVLGLRGALGRLFVPGEGRREAQPEVVLSDSLWHGAFGGAGR